MLDDDSVFLLEVDGHTLAGQLRGKGHGEKKKKLLSFWDGKAVDGGGPCCVGPGDGL